MTVLSFAEKMVEPAGDLAGELDMSDLVLTDWNEPAL